MFFCVKPLKIALLELYIYASRKKEKIKEAQKDAEYNAS